jgi:hypothetical protein
MKKLLFAFVLLLLPVPLRADAFDRYTNPILARVPGASGVQELKRVTADQLTEHDHTLSDVSAALLVVRTNEGRWSKLLLQAGRRKISAEESLPILLIDRFVTYREGEERGIQAVGRDVNLFDGFRFSLDIGQVVPDRVAADIRFVAKDGRPYVEPLGKAQFFLLTQPLADAKPKKDAKLVVGETFEVSYFNGTYKLYDDGRRSGTLKLTVADDGEVRGAYYSDKDGTQYEVSGKVGMPKYSIQFTIKFPRVEQTFQGWLFTGDARALAGSSRLQARETGFYGVRVEE